MKKLLILLLLVCLASFSLASCKQESEEEPNTDAGENAPGDSDGQGDAEKTVYDVLKGLSEKERETVKLDVCVRIDDITLNANYVVKKTSVTYSVERLNLITGDVYDLPDDFKSLLSGTAVVENGATVKVEGDEVSLPEYTELVGKFNYSESCFTDVTASDGRFSASVKSANDFLGVNSDAKNMKITVDYNEAAIEKITLTYDTESAKVTSVYVFE